MAHAPRTAHHLILTYSHDIDLALCHAALTHGFDSCGSDRIRNEMGPIPVAPCAIGHSDAEISRIACPIGDPSLGKHPQAIAVGVAGRLLKERLHKDRQHAASTEGDQVTSRDAA
jgi:xanthine dehydrogenase accessory factor